MKRNFTILIILTLASVAFADADADRELIKSSMQETRAALRHSLKRVQM